jgi:hypothetical protein
MSYEIDSAIRDLLQSRFVQDVRQIGAEPAVLLVRRRPPLSELYVFPCDEYTFTEYTYRTLRAHLRPGDFVLLTDRDAGVTDESRLRTRNDDIGLGKISDLLNLLPQLEGREGIGRVSSESGIRIFISHASEDQDLAARFIDTLERGLVIPENYIRCTSVDGYRLPPGGHTSVELQKELSRTELVIGIVTPHSVASDYVMFELGAGWGMGKWTVAAVAKGISFSDVPGPLREYNAISLSKQGDIVSLIEEVARRLRIEQRPRVKLMAAVDGFLSWLKTAH